MFSHCFRNIIDFWIAKRRGRGEKDDNSRKTVFSHRYGIEQSARFQVDIHFAVRICHGRVFLTGTTGGGCRQWNDDGRKATMPDYVWHRNKVLKPDLKIFFRTTVA